MNDLILIDTGPLVASVVRNDQAHGWACEIMSGLPAPLLTCEPVLTEATYLLEQHGQDATAPLRAVQRGALRIAFGLNEELAAIASLMRRYRNVPMSLADACLVRMSELHERGTIFTTDSDFRIYRQHGRSVIPVLMPPMD